MAITHLLLAAATIRLSFLFQQGLTPHVWRLVAAAALPALVMCLQLVPLPPGLLGWISPGLVLAREPSGWIPASLVPAETLEALLVWCAAATYAVLVAVWWSVEESRDTRRALVRAALGAALFSGAHAALDADAVLGFITPRNDPPTFFAPFVNPNHAASLLLLLLPLTVGAVFDSRRRPAAVVVALTTVAFFLWVGSTGATMAALTVAVVAFLWHRGTVGRVVGGATFALATSVAFAWLYTTDLRWRMTSFEVRLQIWLDLVSVIRHHPITGVGVGAFQQAYPAYSTLVGLSAAHAHSEPLQWLAEAGMLGVIAGVSAGALLFGAIRDARGRLGRRLSLGLLGLALHSLVEFPFRMAAISLIVAGMLGMLSSYQRGPAIAAGPAVRLAQGLAAVQILAVFWALHGIGFNALITESPSRETAEATLRMAPWRFEPLVISAEQSGDAGRMGELARQLRVEHAHDARALRSAGLMLARIGESEDALEALGRAAERHPSDFPNWAVYSRVAEASGDPELALHAWERAVIHWSRRYDDPWPRAFTLSDSALSWLEVAEQAAPNAGVALGHHLLGIDRSDVAVLAFEHALRRLPPGQRHVPAYGAALVAIGDFTEGEAYLEGLIARHPQSAAAHRALARVLEKRNARGDARNQWLNAARISGQPHDYVRAVRVEGARVGPQEAITLGRSLPQTPELDLELARMLRATDDLEGCRIRLRSRGLLDEPMRERAQALWNRCQPDESDEQISPR